MSGIVFLKTQEYDAIKNFYISRIGCELWMDQGDCIILRHGNFLIGFCDRDDPDVDGMLTFFYDTKDDVDLMYEKFKDIAASEPKMNTQYPIYNFFAVDPEGRDIEFQWFVDPVHSYRTGDELLLTRRSIRQFKNDDITDDILAPVFEVCRFAPTSRNTQSYYFKIIRDKADLDWLSLTRGSSTAPIGKAPAAVAVCSDPELSKRHINDGCIAAYHFILAAWNFGLGSCWIAAMDRDDVKQRLDIPQHHYVATITPVGYPNENPQIHERNDREWFIRK